MSNSTHTVSSTLPKVLDGYDLDAEAARAREAVPDVTIAGHTLNRATARVLVGPEPPDAEAARRRHRDAVFTTTLDPDSPVLELGWPTSGHYAMDSRGVHLDVVCAVAQRVIDPRHPNLTRALEPLLRYALFTRREINTDDYLRLAPHCEGVHLPQDLAALLNGAATEAFPGIGGYRTFLTNSGTESGEACLKIACMARYKRFLALYGETTLARVMSELGIAEFAPLAEDTSRPEACYEDYPMFLVGCERAFHGRSLGSLSITASKKVQKVGFPRPRWIHHIPFNAPVGTLAGVLDTRPITEILEIPGELRRVIASRRIPVDLFGGMLVEPFQGEGGYVPATSEFFQDCHAVCRAHGALFMVDEVQTFARTGTLFFTSQLGVEPDAIALAKGLFMGAMVARADLREHLHPGWHSNTWGGGKIFDNQIAYAVLDTLLHHREPVFEGRSLMENQALKGRLVEAGLAEISRRHPQLMPEFVVRGGMARISVRRRKDVWDAAWARGLKILPCGRAGEVAPIRMLFLADVLAREIGEALDLLDAALADIEPKG